MGRETYFAQKLDVAFVDGAIILLLHRRQLDVDNGLLFGRDALLHVLLEPPQNVGPNQLLQLLHLLAGLELAEPAARPRSSAATAQHSKHNWRWRRQRTSSETNRAK